MHGGWVIEDGAVGVLSSYAGGKSALLLPGKKICLSYVLVLGIDRPDIPPTGRDVCGEPQTAASFCSLIINFR